MQNFLELKNLCSSIGLVPTKSKGQNFLVNDEILEKIIKASDLRSDDFVLEIGPGLGVLTEALAKKAKKIIAVELDKKLVAHLKDKFAQQKNIEIIQGDILKLKSETLNFESFQYKLVANLPYQITGAVLRKFLAEALRPKLMVLMLQKEVVERILDKNKKSAIISLVTKLYGQPEMIGFVSKNNFWPKPKVDSAILKIDLFKKNKFELDIEKEQDFIKVIKTGFAHPRKQVASNLSKVWSRSMVELALAQAGKSPTSRAEDIKIEDWYTIYRYIYEGR
jgi:16S rRNA (adenine1518-N6/adenine1519-N6)-dimethyltransferase